MQIQNPSAAQAIREQAGLTLAEGFPQNLSSTVMPVMDMTPRNHRDILTWAIGTSASGNVNPYTGRAGKQLYITGCLITIAKDATCDIATGSITVGYTANGISQTLSGIAVVTLTAQAETIYVSFPQPIKADVNTNCTCNAVFTAGILRRTIVLYGYELDKA